METMTDSAMDIVEDYIAVWNEADPAERRRRIRAVWVPEGTTCYRLMDARGYAAIEQRVVGSFGKWLAEGKYRFRSKRLARHHDVVRLEFVMVRLADEHVEASGICFLLLDATGRIRHDYQFNPSANDASELAARYVAVLNEGDAERRRERATELWATDATRVGEAAAATSVDAILATIARERVAAAARRLEFVPGKVSQAHHHVAHLTWELRPREGGAKVAAGSNLLVFDDSGRIGFDCGFEAGAGLE